MVRFYRCLLYTDTPFLNVPFDPIEWETVKEVCRFQIYGYTYHGSMQISAPLEFWLIFFVFGLSTELYSMHLPGSKPLHFFWSHHGLPSYRSRITCWMGLWILQLKKGPSSPPRKYHEMTSRISWICFWLATAYLIYQTPTINHRWNDSIDGY